MYPPLCSPFFRSGLYSHLVVDGVTQLLLAAQIPLGRLDGDVSEQELNLVQFTARDVAQPGTVRLLCRMPHSAERY